MAHYYHPVTGQLIDRVPYKDKKRSGETKPTGLADARELGLKPSVTTVQDILDKPGIRAYRMEQMAIACLREPYDEHEEWAAYLAKMMKKADEKAEQAAQFGTDVHHAVASLLRGQMVTPASHGLLAAPIGIAAKKWMDDNGFVCEKPEHTFICGKWGYAGTADWIGTFNGKPIILDIKTQEWTADQKDRPYWYEEVPVQLAGYAIGLGLEGHERFEMIVNRNLGVCDPQIKNWSKPTDKIPDPNKHYADVWLSLLHHWKTTKRYWP